MHSSAHIASVPALGRFIDDLAAFRVRAAGAVAGVDTKAGAVAERLQAEVTLAAHRVEVCRDMYDRAVYQLEACTSRRGSAESDAGGACEAEQAEVERTEAELRLAEARLEVLRDALARVTEALTAFQAQRGCLDRVLDIDLTLGDLTLRQKLDALYAYLATVRR